MSLRLAGGGACGSQVSRRRRSLWASGWQKEERMGFRMARDIIGVVSGDM